MGSVATTPGFAHVMTSSYTVMLTAFLIDNGKNPPLAGRLPTAACWLLPAALAAPLITWSLPAIGDRSQHPAPPGQPGQPAPRPARCPGTSRAGQQLGLDPHPGDRL